MDATTRTGDFSGTGEFDVEMRTVTQNKMIVRFYSEQLFRSFIVFDNLSSFYNSIYFDETIDTAEHQVGQSINFGITFNNAVSINGLQFAPTSCEVINGNDDAEVYNLWDSSDSVMCNPDDHPVDFEVYQTPMDSGNQFFGFQYTGNILNNNLVSYHLFLKDSLSTPSMKMWLHNDSNVMLRFVLPMMKIRHAQQAVLNQQPRQQRPQQQPRPLKKSLEILLNVTQYGIRATIRKHVATIVMIILLRKEM